MVSSRILSQIDKKNLVLSNGDLVGDLTLGGGYKIKFTPDFTTSYSWVPFKGCKDCW